MGGLLLGIAGFGLLGALAAHRIGLGLPGQALALLLGSAFGLVALSVVGLLLATATPSVVRQNGARRVARAAAGGFAALFPFAVLGAMAELHLGWDALLPFASAGAMAATAAAASAVVRLGAGPRRSVFVAGVAGLGLTVLFTTLVTLGRTLVR